MHYDCEFEDDESLSVGFKDVVVPNPGCEIVMRKRV